MRHTCVMAILVLLVAGRIPASAATFDVKTLGARGDGVADDAPAIQATIDAAAKGGPGNTVLIPAGSYALLSPGPDRGFYFRIPAEASGLTITGIASKTTFLVAGGRSPFVADRCSNCTIRDIIVDFKTMNVTQGRITAVEPGSKSITIALDAGYAAPTEAIFTAHDRYKPRLRILSAGRDSFDWTLNLEIVSVTQRGTDWVLELERELKQEQIGKRAFIWGSQQGEWCPFIECRGTTNVTVERVADYAGGGFAGGGSAGTLAFTNVYSGPPPGTNRLGFYGGHQGHSRAQVVMKHCQWLTSNDDDVNELTELQDIRAKPAPNTIRIRRSSDYRIGDTVAIWDYANANSAHMRASAVIAQIADAPDNCQDLVLDRDVAVERTGKGDGPPPKWNDLADRVVNLTSGGTWTLIDCAFSSSFAHPLLVKSAAGITVDHCRIYGSDMSGFCGGMQTYWNEGPQCRNVTITNCVFYDIDGISCFLGIEVPNGVSSGSRDQDNLVIENNVFLSGGNHPVWNGITPRGVALFVGNAHVASVKNNLFAGFPNASLAVYSSDQVTISDNIFLRSHQTAITGNRWERSANLDPTALIAISAADQVTVHGNILLNEGPFLKKLVDVAVNTSRIDGADTGVAHGTAHLYEAVHAVVVHASPPPAAPADAGRTYATDLAAPDSAVTFAVTVPMAGRYPLIITYDNASTDAHGEGSAATQRLIVNGDASAAQLVTYPYTGAWGRFNPALLTMTWATLKAGANTVQFAHDTNAVSLQSILIPTTP